MTGAPAARSAPTPSTARWTDKTPDAMIEDAVSRALGPGAPQHVQMGAVATILALSGRAHADVPRQSLQRIAAASSVSAELRGEVALLARALASDEGTESGSQADNVLGVVEAVSLLGPFRDTGGGLDAHDGPEAPDARFDPGARYTWGTYEVKWRAIPRAFATARGVPLDVFVFPRKESCTWVASKLHVDTAQPVLVRVASAGQVRVVFDGHDVIRDENVDEAARFDRGAARLSATAGDHLLAAKVCSGALDDEGRVRLRITDDAGRWPAGIEAVAGPWEQGKAIPHAPVVRPTVTPLARALGDTSSDVDTRLDAALLRTLAGSDDLRSPRAPGILAALAAGAPGSDRLAMIGWVAPSGANRSGWLNEARDQADPPTRAFIDRRLVERHLEAQLADWAMAALRGAHIDSDDDPEARLIQAQVDAALGTDALRQRATHRLEELVKASPASAPDDVLELLSQLCDGANASLALSSRQELARRGSQESDFVRVVSTVRGRVAAASAGARAFTTGSFGDADDALAIAESVAHTGAHEEASGLLQELAQWAPNKAPVWAALAQELGATAARVEVIGASLRRARELDPGDARYRAELALRARSPAPDAESHDDERYIVPSEVILARRQGSMAGAALVAKNAAGNAAPGADAAQSESRVASEVPSAADRELHWVRAVVMHPSRRVSEMVHYAREIIIPPRTEDELYEDIPAEGDLTEILRARVHRRDGTEAFPVEEANENARPRIRWPELMPGDVVEVAFRSWTAGPVGGRGDPPFFRLDYAGALSTHPVLYNEVVVVSPHDRPIFVDVINGKADRREDREDGGQHVVRLVWEKPVSVPDEPLAPPLSEVIPTVVLSTFKDWSAFRGWYGEAVRGFTEPDAQVRELAASLTKGKTSREAKVRALFDFVADHIRYVNYVSGEWWLPNRPQQLLARREGDCDDKALLLITLLKAVGIDAQEVMVQTRLTGEPSILRAPSAAIPVFDHGIAFLPGPNGGTYLDATSPQSRLGPLPSMDARAVALRMDGPPQIVNLPASSPDDHGVDATWTIKVRPDGGADLDGEERASGDDAFWMRTYLTEPGARAQWIEDRLVGAWFSTVEVAKEVDFQGDLPRGGATAHWRARSENLARHEGTELLVPLSPSQPLASEVAPLVRRTLPVWLPPYMAPRKESRTIRVVAPKGWVVRAVPTGGEENGGPFGRARLDLSQSDGDPRTIVAKRTVVFDQSTISVEQYPQWRAWVQRVDALMHKAVRLAPGGVR